jgi:hypothetical protein
MYDNETFRIHKDADTKRNVIKSKQGLLYYMDTEKSIRNTEVVLIETVADKKSKYSNKDYSQAVLARKVQDMIDRPSLKTFLKVVENDLLMNCPITRDDVVAARDIFRPNLGSLKGKTTQRASPHVRPEHHQIPLGIMEKYRDVTLCIDIMFVNKVPFLITISRHIKFGTVEVLKNRKTTNVIAAIGNFNKLYQIRGFRLTLGLNPHAGTTQQCHQQGTAIHMA